MKWAAVVAVVIGLAGCATSFPGVKPLYPPAGNPILPPKVDSLQPTLRWEASKTPDVSYDVVIYEGIEIVKWNPEERQVGKMVYYREAIQGTEHKLEEPLKPDALYYWSVRTRKGDRYSGWSRYDYSELGGLAYYSVNALFSFRTPNTQ